MFDTIIADEFETPTKKKKPDKEQVNRKSRNISPKVADELETATKKKKQNKKEDDRKSRCLSPKVIFTHYHVPIPVLGFEICFTDSTYRKQRKGESLQRHQHRERMFRRRNFSSLLTYNRH